jgi:hypothetical protein
MLACWPPPAPQGAPPRTTSCHHKAYKCMPSLQTGKGASLPALLALHRCDVPTKTPPTQDHCVSHCEPSRWSDQWLLQVHKWPIDWMSLQGCTAGCPLRLIGKGPSSAPAALKGATQQGSMQPKPYGCSISCMTRWAVGLVSPRDQRLRCATNEALAANSTRC